MTNNPNELTIENSALRKVSSVARTTTITLGGDLQIGRIGYGAMRLIRHGRLGRIRRP